MTSKLKKVLIIGLIAITLMGCADNTRTFADVEDRFTVEEVRDVLTERITIITDNETGVQYIFYKNGYGGGLTKLEGRPQQ